MIEYQKILNNNMLNVLKDILFNIKENGLSSNNHLYITFITNHKNVELPNWLKKKYPEEMTIVIQYEYYDLEIKKNNFSISLSFNDINEKSIIENTIEQELKLLIISLKIIVSRAEKIKFTSAYTEIQATYLVPANSSMKSIDQVDQPGIRIAVSARSAYDLWLERNIRKAELIRAQGLDESFDLFVAEKL